MSTEPIRLSSAPDAVTVIAEPSDPRHHGRLRYGELKVGQAYIVDAEEGARLLAAKGFALLADTSPKPKKGKGTDTTTEPQE